MSLIAMFIKDAGDMRTVADLAFLDVRSNVDISVDRDPVDKRDSVRLETASGPPAGGCFVVKNP